MFFHSGDTWRDCVVMKEFSVISKIMKRSVKTRVCFYATLNIPTWRKAILRGKVAVDRLAGPIGYIGFSGWLISLISPKHRRTVSFTSPRTTSMEIIAISEPNVIYNKKKKGYFIRTYFQRGVIEISGRRVKHCRFDYSQGSNEIHRGPGVRIRAIMKFVLFA